MTCCRPAQVLRFRKLCATLISPLAYATSLCLNDFSPMDILTMLVNDPHDDDPDVNVTMSNAVTLSSNNTSLSHHQHVTAT